MGTTPSIAPIEQQSINNDDKLKPGETWLYVLKLQQGKYYVGVSDNVERRLEEHKGISRKESLHRGAAWTHKYPVVELISKTKTSNPLDEDSMVKKLMIEHSIDDVRGGTYSQVKLDEEQREFLNKEIRHALGLCLKCGGKGHYVKDCKNNVKQPTHSSATATQYCESCGRRGCTLGECTYKKRRDGTLISKGNVKYCRKCGYSNHTIEKCYAKKNVHSDGEFCRECGRDTHLTEDCGNKKDRDGVVITVHNMYCSRCGRINHIKSNESCTFNVDFKYQKIG